MLDVLGPFGISVGMVLRERRGIQRWAPAATDGLERHQPAEGRDSSVPRALSFRSLGLRLFPPVAASLCVRTASHLHRRATHSLLRQLSCVKRPERGRHGDQGKR